MYTKGQDSFARGFAVFLLVFILSGALVFLFLFLAPATLLALIPEWMTVAFFALWPVGSLIAAVRFRNHKGILRWIWSKESTPPEDEIAQWNSVVEGIQTKLESFGLKLTVETGLVYVRKADADGFDEKAL